MKHTGEILRCHASVTQHSAPVTHPCPCRKESPFLFISEEHSIVWFCNSLFSHSPVEHLGRFPFGAIIKQMAMNICEEAWWGHMFSFLLSKCAGGELPGCLVSVRLPV